MSATSTPSTNNARAGFTLIEVLVVSPLVILVVGVLVAAIIALTGRALTAQHTASSLGDMQSAFSSIQHDIMASGQITESTDDLTSPQGLNDTGADFVTSDDTLVIRTPALTSDPLSDARDLIYYDNSPHGCSSPDVSANTTVYITHIYFVDDNALWRRTILPSDVGNACTTPWQVNTCAPGQTAPICSAEDNRLVELGDGSFDIEYYDSEGNILADSDAESASTLKVDIQSATSIAGRDVEVSNSSHLEVF